MVTPITIGHTEGMRVASIVTSYAGGGAERETLRIEIHTSSDLGAMEMAELLQAHPPIPTTDESGPIESVGSASLRIEHGPLDAPLPPGDDYVEWSTPTTIIEDDGAGTIATTVIESHRVSRREGGAIHQTEPTEPLRSFVASGPDFSPTGSTVTWYAAEPWGLTASLTLEGSTDNRYQFQSWVYEQAGEANYAPNETGGKASFVGEPRVDLEWREGDELDITNAQFSFLFQPATSDGS